MKSPKLESVHGPIGVMICGHGSRNQNAVREFSVLSKRLTERFPDNPVDYGYLEFANPVIHQGIDALKAQGVNHVLAVPGMLFAAGHAKNDIPSVLNTYQAQNQDIVVDYGRELGIDLRMIRAAGARITDASFEALKAMLDHIKTRDSLNDLWW